MGISATTSYLHTANDIHRQSDPATYTPDKGGGGTHSGCDDDIETRIISNTLRCDHYTVVHRKARQSRRNEPFFERCTSLHRREQDGDQTSPEATATVRRNSTTPLTFSAAQFRPAIYVVVGVMFVVIARDIDSDISRATFVPVEAGGGGRGR